ncbi:MAG: hypothetical protein Q8L34_02295 [Candidatus Woesearchaeota archaeon]|nr:hypothetical protein [Candidatus Woesearchaeota archaeon]
MTFETTPLEYTTEMEYRLSHLASFMPNEDPRLYALGKTLALQLAFSGHRTSGASFAALVMTTFDRNYGDQFRSPTGKESSRKAQYQFLNSFMPRFLQTVFSKDSKDFAERALKWYREVTTD